MRDKRKAIRETRAKRKRKQQRESICRLQESEKEKEKKSKREIHGINKGKSKMKTWRIEITPVAFFPLRPSSSTVTYNLHRTQQRTSMEEKGERRKRERKRDGGREGVSEGLKVGKGEIEERARDKRENYSTGGGWRREEERDLFKK